MTRSEALHFVPAADQFEQLLRPRDSDDEPVFAEPWQAQAFALTVHLHAKGAFTWSEWASALAAEIKSRDQTTGDGAHYYECWLAALERLVCARGMTETAALESKKQAWAEAYRRTPHGRPVQL